VVKTYAQATVNDLQIEENNTQSIAQKRQQNKELQKELQKEKYKEKRLII